MRSVCKALAADDGISSHIKFNHEVSTLLPSIAPQTQSDSATGSTVSNSKPKLTWQLRCADGSTHGPYDHVILSAPKEGSLKLLVPLTQAGDATSAVSTSSIATPALVKEEIASVLKEIESVSLPPCWAVMLAFTPSLAQVIPDHVKFGAAFVHDSPLSWIANNSTKPGRPPTDKVSRIAVVIHLAFECSSFV